ncbi:MAG: hypothetical protein DWQ53_23045 [Microcystis flos-aquae DF17]|nr:MAG: hypothetical protein DWQ53_23045 [Microcystis flos-aquae DF17]
MDRNGDDFLLHCQNAHTIGQSQRGIAAGVVYFIENLGLKPRRSTTALLLNMSIVYEIYAKM